MFTLAAGLYDAYLVSREVSVLLIGCNNAGKTSLLERLKVTDFTASHQREDSNNAEDTMLVVNTCSNEQPNHFDRYHLLDSHGHFRNNNDINLARKTRPHSLGRSSEIQANDEFQYNLMPGKRMLPSHLIRPTIGMNLAKLEAFGLRVKVLDLSGSASMRSLWDNHYASTDAIVYVVDISSPCHMDKLYEARAFFLAMRDDDSTASLPILIFFNKVDQRPNIHPINSSTATYTEPNNNKSTTGNPDSSLAHLSIADIASLFLKPVNAPPTAEFKLSLSNSKQDIDVDAEKYIPDSGLLHAQTAQDENIHTIHKPIMAISTGSAKTGEGVRVAFTWLLHTIKTRS